MSSFQKIHHMTGGRLPAESIWKLIDGKELPVLSTFLEKLFQQVPDLTYLNLEWARLGPEEIHVLAKGLESAPRLEHLNFRDNHIGPDGMTILASGIEQAHHLVQLDLGNNQIGPRGASALGKVMWKWSHLTRLDLDQNQLGPEGIRNLAEGAQHVVCPTSTEWIPTVPWTHLNLAQNSIGPDGMLPLTRLLFLCKNLTNLYLQKNRIGIQGAQRLLNTNILDHLIHLDLHANQIDSGMGCTLGQAFRYFSGLEYLNLSYNSLRSEDLCLWMRMLPRTVRLQVLILSHNHIGPEGAGALARSLGHFPLLHTLQLSSNQIGTEGAQAFGWIQNPTPLRFLDVRKNRVDPQGLLGLFSGLYKYPQLNFLGVQYSYIHPMDIQAFRNLVPP